MQLLAGFAGTGI